MPPPDHIQRLVHKIARRVGRDFQLDFGVENAHLIVNAQNPVRRFANQTFPLFIAAAHIHGLAPIIVDGRELQQEIGDKIVDLFGGIAPRGQVRADKGLQRLIQPAGQRAHLIPVYGFAEHEIQIDQLQRLIGIPRAAFQQAAQARGDPRCLGVRERERTRAQAPQKAQDRLIGDFHALEKRLFLF